MKGGLNELALFSGGGGGLLASKLLGWNTVAACEIEEYPRNVVLQRQRDGMLEPFPIWDDVRTFDGKPWRGLVDVVSGGFPCQDISSAGKGAGLAGDRSGLWFEYLRIVDEVRPRFVFAENSPNLRTRGLGAVIEGLASLGYGVRWCVLGAWHLGAPHKRDRMWVLAYADSCAATQRGQHATCQSESGCGGDQLGGGGGDGGEGCAIAAREVAGVLADTASIRQSGQRQPVNASDTKANREGQADQPEYVGIPRIWQVEPRLGRVSNGVADRVDRLKAIGNGQVPAVAAAAFNILSKGIL